MTAYYPAPKMPAIESMTTLLVGATAAAALSIVAGNETAKAAADAAATVQQAAVMSDQVVIYYSIFWGLMGAIVSWCFKLLPQNLAEGGRAVLGSALTAGIVAPAILVYYKFPPTIIPIATIAGVTGIIANAAVLKLFPLLVNLLPDWLKNLFKTRGINTDDYDMSHGRPRTKDKEKDKDGAKTQKLARFSPEPPARRRPPVDDGSNAP